MHAHTHTHISSNIVNLTASWYFIKIKYSEPNISAPASVSPLAFAVLLLAVIKQCCIAAGAPFWIGGELPVFVVRPHAPNRDACTVTVRYEYMYRATPTSNGMFSKIADPCTPCKPSSLPSCFSAGVPARETVLRHMSWYSQCLCGRHFGLPCSD